MSMRNFPKIPKIILRKSCEQVKDAKNEKVFFCTDDTNPITRLAKPLCSMRKGFFQCLKVSGFFSPRRGIFEEQTDISEYRFQGVMLY